LPLFGRAGKIGSESRPASPHRTSLPPNPEIMADFWMVRAGEGGYLSDDFQRASCIGVGWQEVGSFEHVRSLEKMRDLIREVYPNSTPTQVVISGGMAYKFRHTIRNGDRVISYDPRKLEYLLGTVAGNYEYGRD
jgi:restriction system protein